MKGNKLKLFGIIAAVVVIGLSMASCGDGANGGGDTGGGNTGGNNTGGGDNMARVWASTAHFSFSNPVGNLNTVLYFDYALSATAGSGAGDNIAFADKTQAMRDAMLAHAQAVLATIQTTSGGRTLTIGEPTLAEAPANATGNTRISFTLTRSAGPSNQVVSPYTGLPVNSGTTEMIRFRLDSAPFPLEGWSLPGFWTITGLIHW